MNITGFEILEKVGEAGVAVIYKARQHSLNRIVNLKILEPKLSNVGEVKDFVHEARIVAAFKHPNVVEVYDIGEENGVFFAACEALSGKTIRRIVEQEGTFTVKRAFKVMEQTAEAFNAAWLTARLVHRDITPDNLFITDDGWVKITGFGQVRPTDAITLDAFIKAGLISPNLNFISPEQAAEKKTIDTRADMYSLGAVLYFMLTGQVPFKESPPMEAMKRHLNDRLPHPRDVNHALPPAPSQFIIKLMMKAPEDRPPNWETVLTDIRKIQAGRIIAVHAGWENRSTILPLQHSTTRAASVKSRPTPPPGLPFWITIPIWVVIILSWLMLICLLFRPQIERTIKKQTVENRK